MTIGVERVEGVVRLTLDRPGQRNALDDQMVSSLTEVIEQAGLDEAVRVITLSGSGADFCGGFDILGRNAPTGAPRPRAGSIQRRMAAQTDRLISVMTTVQTPIVACVRGWAVGLGLQLVLAADFAVAADNARLWEPFSRRGFTPDSAATWLLPRRGGEKLAREMLLLGRQLDGREAASLGLLHDAVPEARLDETVRELVDRLAAGPTVSLGLTKWLLHSGATASLGQQLRDEALAMELSSRSEDFREGIRAMAEKRQPGFKGR